MIAYCGFLSALRHIAVPKHPFITFPPVSPGHFPHYEQQLELPELAHIFQEGMGTVTSQTLKAVRKKRMASRLLALIYGSAEVDLEAEWLRSVALWPRQMATARLAYILLESFSYVCNMYSIAIFFAIYSIQI